MKVDVVNDRLQEPIAIIGMACVFPKAPDIKVFWRNILDSVDAIDEPLPAWGADRYLRDKRINTSRGGYLKDLFCFDPISFGIMPSSMDGGEPDHFLALKVAYNALLDAGYASEGDTDHSDTGIVLGHSTYLHRGQANHIQHHLILDQTLDLIEAIFPDIDSSQKSFIRELLYSKLPQSNADNAPGLVPNVMTGRIANRLNLKGPNYIVDGACASSLLAVGAAMDELRTGRSRMMLAGGVNGALPAEAAVIFTQLGALSKSGNIKPFDASADGTLLGEGAGVLVLKRLSDALADKDRIYALIRTIGIASDGKALGLLAPNAAGEVLAIERAYSCSGIDPASVGLVEAHGTGIPLGDQTELTALKTIFGKRKGLQGHIALGTIKSMIGHCIPAAGIAGLIKSALALHHRILPPTRCSKINPDLGIEQTTFFINTTSRAWNSNIEVARRAAVNAFGFGGINTHAVLEEIPASALKPLDLSVWPFELFVFSASTKTSLAGKLKETASLVTEQPDLALCDLAANSVIADDKGPFRLSIVARDTRDFLKKIESASRHLSKKKEPRWSTRDGIVYSCSPIKGKIAFMFPGEGSQYLGMFAGMAMHFRQVGHWFDFWRGLYDESPGESRLNIVFPPESELTDQRRIQLEARLYDMDIGSEAVFVASQAIYAILRTLGVRPDAMVGHSTGENSALAASGAMVYDSFQQLGNFIKDLNGLYRKVLEADQIPTGALLSVGALPQSTIEEQIARHNSDIVVAMDNCANQQILYGPKGAINEMQQVLSAAGGICMPLPFDRGYHTHWFSAMSEAFAAYYDKIGLVPPSLPLYSCANVALFPEDDQGVREAASRQWSVRVRFRETISRMHADGIRYFVEVGPSGNLCSFVNDILSGKEYLAVATNLRQKNDIQQFLISLAYLYVNCKEVDLGQLFPHRAIASINPPQGRSQKIIDNTLPFVHLDQAERVSLQEIILKPATNPIDNGNRTNLPKCEILINTPVQTENYPKMDIVMKEYFDLMNHFLDQQQRVLENNNEHGKCTWTDSESDFAFDPATPLLNSIVEIDERHLVATCRLCVHEDNFLKHHILSGKVSEIDPDLLGLSCIPLMVSLEIMAETCTILHGDNNIGAIENINAFGWITLDHSEVELLVHAELSIENDKRIHAKLLHGNIVVVSADFIFDAAWSTKALPELMQKKEFRWDAGELYNIGMFHGPIFRSIRHIEGWNEQGIDAVLSEVSLEGFLDDKLTPELILNPVLLDALGQLAAYWYAQQIGTDFNCFPSSIERIELYQSCPQHVLGLKCRARQHPLDPAVTDIAAPRAWDFECLDSENRPILRAIRMVNIYFPVPHQFYRVRRDPLNGRLGNLERFMDNNSQRQLNNSDFFIWQLPHLSKTFCNLSGGIFLKILAHIFLNSQERISWQELEPNLTLQMQWLFGRACIKEAVRFWIHQQTGQLLYPSDVMVLHDDLGAPYVDGWWNGDIVPAPEVSLSHNKHISVVAVEFPSIRVGIDIEHIERIKRTDLIQGALAAREQEMLRAYRDEDLKQRLLRLWCAKEAAAKYLGTGLQGMPQAFNVSFLDKDWQQARVSHKESTVEVNVYRKNQLILALASAKAA
jgi:acyl transferase domain-containing protein/phosphopantetheinyl transferase (holo-ACP synthase)